MAARLQQAFAACGNSAARIKKEIAKELGITIQAVNGWVKTGTLRKTSLPVVARYTGQSVDFFLGVADMTSREEQEVELVLRFRDLPEVLQLKLLSDAETYVELAQQTAAAKPARQSRK